MRYLKLLALLCVILLIGAGCGQRGPLYLPEDSPEENKPETSQTSPNNNNQHETQV